MRDNYVKQIRSRERLVVVYELNKFGDTIYIQTPIPRIIKEAFGEYGD